MEENNIVEKEEWLPVVGYEGLYEVSNMGRVRSLDRIVANKNNTTKNIKGKMLKQSLHSDKRYKVNLGKKGVNRTWKVHILVALSFIGPRPEGYQVCHIDGDKHNNKLSNLRYDTQQQNNIDMYRYGNKNGNGKLSVNDVLEIRNLYKTGNYSYRSLSSQFNVSYAQIGYIINRKCFNYINDDGSINDSDTAVS